MKKVIRVLIVEDEINIRIALREALRMYKDVLIVAEARNGAEGREAFEKHRPDVVFSDIVMETKDAGLRLATWLNQQPNPPHIVFVTAYPDFSGQAIRHRPADFLTKPWHEDELAQALQWIRENPKQKEERIFLTGKINGRKMVGWRLPKEIMYLSAGNNIVSAHLANGQVVSDIQYTLQEWETELRPLDFFLIHRGKLVNRQHAKWMTPRINSECYDLLVGPGEERLEIAKEKREEVGQWLSGHLSVTPSNKKLREDELKKQRAIAQQEYLEVVKKHLSDPLTGLGSRVAFVPKLEEEISQAQRSSNALSLLMLDADDFKRINTRCLYEGGDKTLQKLAGLLRELTREVDFTFRWGGDEFYIVLADTVLKEALVLAERIRDGVANATDWPCEPMTVSIGAAQWQPGQDAAALMTRANEALFRAKQQKNTVSQ